MYFGDAANALQPDGKPTLENGAIMSGSVVMDVKVASTGEAEYALVSPHHNTTSTLALSPKSSVTHNQLHQYSATSALHKRFTLIFEDT